MHDYHIAVAYYAICSCVCDIFMCRSLALFESVCAPWFRYDGEQAVEAADYLLQTGAVLWLVRPALLHQRT